MLQDLPVHDVQYLFSAAAHARVVGDDDDGHALGVELLEQVQHRGAGFLIQGAGGFVRQHDLGTVDQGPGDGHPLLLAAGQLGGQKIQPVSQPHPLQGSGSLSRRSALYNVTFSVGAGETIGVIGGTGSGKSTLVSLVSRLYDATKGSVLVGGRNVKDYDLKTLRSAVAVVLQQNTLFTGSILDNLRWGRSDATLEECREACRMAQADEFIMEMPNGYDTHIEQGGTNVSGGQKQRLCIARALLRHPKILILDDSTSACDTDTDRKIQQAFRTQLPEMTKLIIAQRISSVQHCDRILVMEGGHVTGYDTHEHLLETNQFYREVNELQSLGTGDFDKV